MFNTRALSTAQNSLLNTIGSIFYCMCQWLITLIVVRFSSNYENAGILQLVISITNIFYVISCFNLRTYQISDLHNECSASEYLGLRLITCLVSVFLCVAYSIVFGYKDELLICIIIYVLFKQVESLSDYFQAVQQIHSNLRYTCYSFVVRGVVSVLAFGLVLKLTDSVAMAITAMSVSTFLIVLAFDYPVTNKFEKIYVTFNLKKSFSLLLKCLPSVLSTVVFVCIVTIPRQYLEKHLGANIFGAYATIATPIVFVQLLSTSIFTPLLSDIANLVDQQKKKELSILLIKILICLVGFTLIVLLAGKLIGTWCYCLIYGQSIREYCYLMYPIIVSAGLYAFAWLLMNTLIVMRRMISVFFCSTVALAISILTMKSFVESLYINGLTISIIAGYLLFIVLSMMVVFFGLEKKVANESN